MSEKVLMQKKTRERLLTAGDGCAFISGLLLSALPIETSWWLLLLLFSFFYVRKRKEMILLSIACIGTQADCGRICGNEGCCLC